MSKRWIGAVAAAAVLLCGCSGAGQGNGQQELPAFPGTGWEMNAQQVLDACGISRDETLVYSDYDGAPAFSVADREVLGAQAEVVNFSFVDLGTLGGATAEDAGQEVLAQVTVVYPAGTDMAAVADALDDLYPDTALEELTLYPLYNPLNADGLYQKAMTASDQCRLWGSETVGEALGEADAAAFREGWPAWLPGMTAADWDSFADSARLVTVVCEDSDQGLTLQFDGYNLAVCRYLQAQQPGA